jgi:hypothetical protein
MDDGDLPVDDAICALRGAGPVSREEMNLLLRRVAAYHLRPMKQQLAETEKTLKEHVETCSLNSAHVLGGIRVLTWLVSSGIGLYVLTALAKFVHWI